MKLKLNVSHDKIATLHFYPNLLTWIFTSLVFSSVSNYLDEYKSCRGNMLISLFEYALKFSLNMQIFSFIFISAV